MFFTFIVEPSEVTLEQGAPFEVGENNVVVNPDTHDAVPPHAKWCFVIHYNTESVFLSLS